MELLVCCRVNAFGHGLIIFVPDHKIASLFQYVIALRSVLLCESQYIIFSNIAVVELVVGTDRIDYKIFIVCNRIKCEERPAGHHRCEKN